ncbi:patatin-like phospholipase family protein [Plesiocystis pacifica]|uniref:patatin-like phospholipase family protein n=1 Tax=Plesiocystis pacifica TaxID=191768 RepID=UPI0018DB70DB
MRSLLRQSVGLALGGGAALGFAHVGVLEALERMGVEVDFIHGTSMGAVVGAAYLGLGATELRRRVELMRRPVDWMKLVDPSRRDLGGALGQARAHLPHRAHRAHPLRAARHPLRRRRPRHRRRRGAVELGPEGKEPRRRCGGPTARSGDTAIRVPVPPQTRRGLRTRGTTPGTTARRRQRAARSRP